MKRIDLTKEQHSLTEVLTFAKSEAVLIHSPSGEDFVLASADEFDREVVALGASEKFASFLDARSKESGDIPLRNVRQKRGV
jgi:PHD/YefM family antitoxin component YafN of YafNO toxin-antitoxin module